MSKEMEDQQIEAYIGALDEDWADTEDDVVLTNEALEALVDADAVTKHVIRKTRIDDNDGDDANEINGTIIMDADGNYYFHTSKGAIEVKPLKYKNPSKVLKMKSATVVKQGAKRITSYDSKRTAEKRKLSHSKKSVDDHVNVHDSNNDCQAIKTSEYTSHQSDDLKSYELIIPETEAEFCSINNTSGTSEQQYPEHQQQQQQQDGTTATQVAFNAMTIYYCKYCTFKTNNEQLLENHLETCEKTKEIAKKQDEQAKKKEENKVKVEDKGNPVKRKVGRPRKKFTPPRLTTAIKSEEAQKFSQKKKLKDSKCKKSDNQIRHNQNETGNKTVNDTINETVNDTVNDNDTYIDMSTTEDPDYVPQNDVAVRTEAFIKSFNKGCSDTANDKERKCPQCPYTTMKKFAFSRHLKTHSDDRPYKCSICEKGFKTNASLQNHVNTHLGKKPHLCNDCGKSFTTSGELVRHSRYRDTGVRPHKCTECDYASVEMSKLKRHMRCHTGERPYQCPHCTYASPDSFKLKRHLRTHTGEKPYECDICHARFTQSNSLKYHRLIHSVNEKPVFQCPMCPTTCGRKTDLRLHVQNLHSTDKTWPCNRCGKELPDRYSFKMHIKTHEGEKCFQCKYCPYASVMQRHLTIHMLLHTDEKPFKCETCEMPFRQKMLLQRHINVYHSNNYVPPKPREKTHACPHCDKAFCFKGNLIRHMEVHDPSAAVEQRQFELKIGRLVRIMSDKDNTNSSNIKESNERDDRERFSESNIDNNGKKEIIDDYNIDVDINEALMESFPDQDEMEYQKEVAEDENCEEEEAYYLYEEIEDDEADEDVLEEQLKPSLLINSIKRVQLNNTTTKGATGQSIQQYQQKIPKKMSKLVLKKNKDNSVLAEHQPINVKVEKETSLSDNVVVIEIVQCNDEALIGHEGNGNGQEAREDEEERVVIQEMLERGGTSDDIEMIATNQHTIEEKKIKRKQKWKQPNLSAIEILDNDKNITVDNCFDFEEDGEVTLVSDANGRTIEFFEITEAI